MMSSQEFHGDALSQAKGQLTFDWSRVAPVSLRLFFFLILSWVAHGFCFYLFQVVYPPSERFSPSPARITFLTPNDAASQAMLREVEDRIVFINSSGWESAAKRSAKRNAIEFKPSFAEHELKLKTMPAPVPVELSSDPLMFLGPLLPPRLAPEALASTEIDSVRLAREVVPSIKPGPGLSDRPVVAPGNWNWALDRVGELKGREVTLMVGIDAEGKPQHVLPHSGIGEELDGRIVTSSRNIQFEPAPGTDLQWGKLLFRW